MQRIYLDNNATTPLDPRVFKAMLDDLGTTPANPSSIHWFGQRARLRLMDARERLATFFGAKKEEIVFTSGGTEGVNTLLKGLGTNGHVISTNIEHSCVYQTLLAMEQKGLSVTYLPTGLWGAPLPEQVEAALRPDTVAIMLSAVNTETGVLLDVESVAQIAEKRKVPFFLDAVALAGKKELNLPQGVSGCVISGHKFHAPKGSGAFFLRKKTPFTPLMTGGGQEGGKRAGSENLAGIIGLGEAAEILREEQLKIEHHLYDLRGRFENGLKTALEDILIHGEGPRIGNVSNVAFLGVDGETLLLSLDAHGVAVSHGSACSSGALEPSRVLLNMGVERKVAKSSLRFSFSRMNTREEIDLSLEILIGLIKKLR